MKSCFIPLLLIIYSIAVAQTGSSDKVVAITNDITGGPSTFMLTRPAVAESKWNFDVYQRCGLMKNNSYAIVNAGVSGTKHDHRYSKISVGSVLVKNAFWGCVTGLILGTAAGFQINDDLYGRTKTGNVFFFSAVGGSMGVITGLVVGVVKIVRQRKTVNF